jgi:hypothetical protein
VRRAPGSPGGGPDGSPYRASRRPFSGRVVSRRVRRQRRSPARAFPSFPYVPSRDTLRFRSNRKSWQESEKCDPVERSSGQCGCVGNYRAAPVTATLIM